MRHSFVRPERSRDGWPETRTQVVKLGKLAEQRRRVMDQVPTEKDHTPFFVLVEFDPM